MTFLSDPLRLVSSRQAAIAPVRTSAGQIGSGNLRSPQARLRIASASSVGLEPPVDITPLLIVRVTLSGDTGTFWSGERESNPRHELGRLSFYH